MPLNRFEVVDASSSNFEGAVIHSHDGRALVLAHVSPRAFGDYFNRPRVDDVDCRRLTKRQCNLLAHSNLDQLSAIVARKYAAGQFSMHGSWGWTYPLIEVTHADLSRGADELSDAALLTAEMSG